MEAGTLNCRIEIQAKHKATDAAGATVTEWRPLMKLWANIRHTSGAETIKGDMEVGIVKASIRVRWNPKITADMRVVLKNGDIYDIKSVLPDLTLRRFVDLVCEKAG
ncbi:phage head closure protein [Neisseria musculi]|uniref:Phage head-tail joining family protein n=1 Tax=Neisseria musculi TaxID=1815583 RepID=A0A7H1MD42_9NEIS|nr:phage head closure protein [Neisseria musculi]QNT59557.1 phage head-tail joining family protein [Neisseria musculi]